MGRPYASERSSSRTNGRPPGSATRAADTYANDRMDRYDADTPVRRSRPDTHRSDSRFPEEDSYQGHDSVGRNDWRNISRGQQGSDRFRYEGSDHSGEDVLRGVASGARPSRIPPADSEIDAHVERYDAPSRHSYGHASDPRDFSVSHDAVDMYDEYGHRSTNERPSVRPSSTMILEGLPSDVTEDDVSYLFLCFKIGGMVHSNVTLLNMPLCTTVPELALTDFLQIMDGLSSVRTEPPFRPDSVRVIRLRSNKRGELCCKHAIAK